MYAFCSLVGLTLVVLFLSWEAAYKKELETFKDIGDIGEIW